MGVYVSKLFGSKFGRDFGWEKSKCVIACRRFSGVEREKVSSYSCGAPCHASRVMLSVSNA